MAEFGRGASRLGRPAVVAGVVLFMAGQSAGLIPLLRHGRGHYASALAFIVSHSPSGPVFVAGDHEFRNRKMVEFYAARIPGGSRLSYVAAPEWSAHPQSGFWSTRRIHLRAGGSNGAG